MITTKQGRPLLPFVGYRETSDMTVFSTIVEIMKDQYAGWLNYSTICETNSQIALSEREYDRWHDLFLEAEFEATNYWATLHAMGYIEGEN